MLKTGSNIEPRNKFFQVNATLVDSEIHPGKSVSFFHEVCLDKIEVIRSVAGAIKPSYTAFLLRAIAIATKEHSYVNHRIPSGFFWRLLGYRLQKFDRIDIGVAVERKIPGAEGAAFVEIIRDVDRLSLEQVAQTLRTLVTQDFTQSENWNSFQRLVRYLPPRVAAFLIGVPNWLPSLWEKYRGGAILISSPGKYGIDGIAGTWPWPVAFSFGTVRTRPAYEGEKLKKISVFTLTMNFDRRIMAGAPAAIFCRRVIELLENPEQL